MRVKKIYSMIHSTVYPPASKYLFGESEKKKKKEERRKSARLQSAHHLSTSAFPPGRLLLIPTVPTRIRLCVRTLMRSLAASAL